jgi:hypothetical protein
MDFAATDLEGPAIEQKRIRADGEGVPWGGRVIREGRQSQRGQKDGCHPGNGTEFHGLWVESGGRRGEPQKDNFGLFDLVFARFAPIWRPPAGPRRTEEAGRKKAQKAQKNARTSIAVFVFFAAI